MERIIFHIDVNSAFLSWEAVYRLVYLKEKTDLRTIPSAVGGDKEKRHGIILAKSIPAKAFGVKTGESLGEALAKCPDLVIVPPRYRLYEASSQAFMEILRSYTPVVQQYSIDEAFMDMTGTRRLWGAPVTAAGVIRDRIYRELGFTVNIGVSNCKLLAKMASDFKKPNRVHTLFPDEIARKMWPLDVEDLFFVGRSTTKKLFTLGIHTIGDLAHADPALLCAHLGKAGLLLSQYANGVDLSPVETAREANKGYGNSTTIDHDLLTLDEMDPYLLALCETVCTRLRADSRYASVAAVSVRDCFLSGMMHQRTLLSPTANASELYRISRELVRECWNGLPVRQLGVHTSGLSDSAEQHLNLFDGDRFIRQDQAEHAVDEIRARFGEGSIMRARFLSSGKSADTGGKKQPGGAAPEPSPGSISSPELFGDKAKKSDPLLDCYLKDPDEEPDLKQKHQYSLKPPGFR